MTTQNVNLETKLVKIGVLLLTVITMLTMAAHKGVELKTSVIELFSVPEAHACDTSLLDSDPQTFWTCEKQYDADMHSFDEDPSPVDGKADWLFYPSVLDRIYFFFNS